ncbi:MAG: histidinol-phosphate transaminase [Candidatus Odinarchaeia archaeon]
MVKKLTMRKTLEGFEQYTAEVHFKKLEELSKFNKILKLDGNENLFIKQEEINNIILDSLKDVKTSIYTDTTCEDLRESIAGYFNLTKNNVMVGNGADGVIDTIVKTFLDTTSEAIVVEPTYSIYKFFIKIMGCTYKPVLLTDEFKLDSNRVLSEVNKNTKMIFICSPNNPTGNQFDYKAILKILDESNCIVVLDEAYVEYGKYSMIPALEKYPNLIIIKTMSKIYGLASLRSGYCLANQTIIDSLLKVSPPYPVNIIAQKIIPQLLEKHEMILKILNELSVERDFLFNELSKINGLKPFKSDANFILFKVNDKNLDANKLHKKLLEKGVIVRNRSMLPLLENCLRVTVAPREINKEFLKRLKTIMS